MILGSKTSEKSATRSATARFDHESARGNEGSWLDRATAQLREAFAWHIPAGYQDETGFHCGDPRVMESNNDTASDSQYPFSS